MDSNDKTVMAKPNQMVQVAETERYKKEENNQAYLLTWTKSCQHHTQTQNANKQQTSVCVCVWCACACGACVHGVCMCAHGVCVCVCVCVCLFVCLCLYAGKQKFNKGWQGQWPHVANRSNCSANQLDILETEGTDTIKRTQHTSSQGSHNLPFVYEFICERISRLSLHDIGLCFFIGQGNGGDLTKWRNMMK